MPTEVSLVNQVLDPEAADALRERAPSLPGVKLSPLALSDAQMIAVGGFSPLEGFLGEADYRAVAGEMRLADGRPWSMPVVLGVEAEETGRLREGEEVALYGPDGELVGVLHLEERYQANKQWEAQSVYRTTEEAHPGVANLYARGEVLLGGKVRLLPFRLAPEFAPFNLTPAQTRAEIAERGWKTVVGFQTRNPVHRAHEYIQKTAMESVDGLLLHPLVGETKAGDTPADVRMRCYQALLENYYPAERVLLNTLPAFMRYAGPKEAVFHALVRRNYGCTHFIVGRDHAGVGSYYGTYDAQRIFSEFAPGELGIQPLLFENSFYCRRCGGMGTNKTCPHDEEARVNLSGTQVRQMLAAGELPPPEFSRPEVARILMEAEQGART